MSQTRGKELKRALGFVKAAGVRLREGKLADAVRYHGYAVSTLAFVLGAQSTRPDAVQALKCTATLHRVVAEIGFQVEDAIRVQVASVAVALCPQERTT